MNKFLKFAPYAFLACSALLVSCGDDGDDSPVSPVNPVTPATPSADNVFTNGNIPASVDGASIALNDKGQVTKIDDENRDITFEYGTFSRSEFYDVKMTIQYKGRDEKAVLFFQLNEMGFISHALEDYIDSYGTDTQTYDFKYDAEGHMVYAYCSDDEETYNITYTDGVLDKVVETEDDGDTRVTTFHYTSAEVTTPYENKGNIMFFDQWNIDLDRVGKAYYAGLLGKPSKNLPLGYTAKGKEGDSEYSSEHIFYWEFTVDGLPTVYKDGQEGYGYNETYTFSWK